MQQGTLTTGGTCQKGLSLEISKSLFSLGLAPRGKQIHRPQNTLEILKAPILTPKVLLLQFRFHFAKLFEGDAVLRISAKIIVTLS